MTASASPRGGAPSLVFPFIPLPHTPCGGPTRRIFLCEDRRTEDTKKRWHGGGVPSLWGYGRRQPVGPVAA